MTEDTLKARIRNLEAELEKKDTEIHSFLDRIEDLEETIMRLDALIPEEDGKKKSKKKQAEDSKMAIEIDEKDKQIRELKNSMGFLRKEKLQLQQELDRIKAESKDSSVIRVEELRSKSPLNVLVKELQDKLNKQQSLINKLKSKNVDTENFDEKLKEKEEELETYKLEVLELNQKLKELSSASEDTSRDSITKTLIEDLQGQLNKTKRQVSELKQKLAKSDKKNKREFKDLSKAESFKKEISKLKELLEVKDKEIDNLKKDIIKLQKAEIAPNFEQTEAPSGEMIKALKEDLQNKLNKAKIQIASLQEQLKKYQGEKAPESSKTQKELVSELKMKREMALFLQKQLETKEGEIETIKNEAVQIKRRYRQLENQLRLKDQKLNDIQHQLDSFNIQTQVQLGREDPHLELRIRELKKIVDDLEKQNIEQRLEISQLRKKI
ncbi:MAG: hypothetical protein ACFE75_04830 [Candidatus Hodarchaeota archaeon]